MLDGTRLQYCNLFNFAGLQTDRVAPQLVAGGHYCFLLTKGLYRQLNPGSFNQTWTSFYTVVDFSKSFQWVHRTPSAEATPLVSICLAVSLAWGAQTNASFRRWSWP